MGTRSDIIVHRADGKWHRIYCHWDGYLSHNGKILFEHYTDQKHADALVALGNLSILERDIGKRHSFDKRCSGNADAAYQQQHAHMCLSYLRDRPMGGWHFAKTKAEFIAAESGEVGDSLPAVWPEADTWTEFAYVWDQGKWWVTDPDEGTQTLVDLGDALSGKRTVKPSVKVFGAVIGQHGAHDPAVPGRHTWSSAQRKVV